MSKNSISFRVYVTPEEKAAIQKAADECKTSMSAYCRILALGTTPPSKFDVEQIGSLTRMAADLSRLGNLMKMLLTNKEKLDDMGGGMGEATIDGVLVDIRATNAKLRELVEAISLGHPVSPAALEVSTLT